eukprot:maker-scaffold713_size108309-snap-gene-0.11 protein:Tk04837 transcript:maker-scaffold713_size108309-snap-gene-0.11-mRNA-1 annotation:"hypothetical protein AND_010472"
MCTLLCSVSSPFLLLPVHPSVRTEDQPEKGSFRDKRACGTAADAITVTSPFSSSANAFPPTVCGTLTGQHMYLETGTSGSAGTLSIAKGTGAGSRSFQIKATYYTCDNLAKAPAGCTQYFTGTSGNIKSYNFGGGQLLQAQNYNNCIRQAEGNNPTIYEIYEAGDLCGLDVCGSGGVIKPWPDESGHSVTQFAAQEAFSQLGQVLTSGNMLGQPGNEVGTMSWSLHKGEGKEYPDKKLELLGVKFDSSFSTLPHGASVAASARQRADMIARLSQHLPKGAYMQQLARGLVLSKRAGLSSLNELTVHAVAMETWRAFHSQDGPDGSRNALGLVLFQRPTSLRGRPGHQWLLGSLLLLFALDVHCQEKSHREKQRSMHHNRKHKSQGNLYDVNRMRLQKLDFRTLTTTFDATGTCGTVADAITVTSPFSSSANAFPPTVCGTLTGQHMYIETGITGTAGTLTIAKGTGAGSRNYQIKATYYTCDNLAKAPAGCTQYLTGISGNFASFNYPGGQLLQAQNYNNCIRQEEGYCNLQVKESGTTTPDPFFLSAPAVAATAACQALSHIVIPNPTMAMFCGGILSNVEANTVPGVVTTAPGSAFQVGVLTLSATLAGITGFNLDYTQI